MRGAAHSITIAVMFPGILLVLLGVFGYPIMMIARSLEILSLPPIVHLWGGNRPIPRDAWIAGCYPQRYWEPHRHGEPRLVSPCEGPYPRGEALSREELDERVLDAAFELEFRARRVFADMQLKEGIQKRMAVVWTGSVGEQIGRRLATHRPDGEVRVHLDRALAWWSAALAGGMEVFEKNGTGHDDVTRAFTGFEAFAEAQPAIHTAQHGVLDERWERRYEREDPRVPKARADLAEAMFRVVYTAVVLVVVFVWYHYETGADGRF